MSSFRDFVKDHQLVSNCRTVGLALEASCRAANLELCQEIYTRFPNYDYVLYIESLLESACLQGEIDIAKWIMSICDCDDFRTEINSIFKKVCSVGRLDVVQWLVESRDIDDNTIVNGLCLAANNDHVTVVQFIQNQFANLSLTNSNHVPVLVCLSNPLDLKKWLYENPANTTTFSLLCADRRCIIVESTIFDIKINADDLCYALDMACRNGNIDVARWLISIGVLTYYPDLFYNVCVNGLLEIAQLIHETWPRSIDNIMSNPQNQFDDMTENDMIEFVYGFQTDDVFLSTCINGELSVAKWLYDTFIVDSGMVYQPFLIEAVFISCCDDLPMLKFLDENFNMSGAAQMVIRFMIEFRHPISQKNINVIRWIMKTYDYCNTMHNNNILTVWMMVVDFNNFLTTYRPVSDAMYLDALNRAVEVGNVDVCDYIISKIPHLQPNYKLILDRILVHGNVAMIEWISGVYKYFHVIDPSEIIDHIGFDHYSSTRFIFDTWPNIDLSMNSHSILRGAIRGGQSHAIKLVISKYQVNLTNDVLNCILRQKRFLSNYQEFLIYTIRYFDLAKAIVDFSDQKLIDDLINKIQGQMQTTKSAAK